MNIKYKDVLFVFFVYLLITFNLIMAESYSDVIILGDDVMFREYPDQKSNPMGRFPKGRIVSFIKKSSKVETINGNKGEWIYIGAYRSNSVSKKGRKGWIFDYYVGYKDNFKKVENWNISHYEGSIVDTDVEFDFKENGSFKMYISYPFSMSEEKMNSIAKILKGEYNKKRKKIELTGHLYKYKNIYWAKTNTQNEGGNYYFFLNEKGEIELNLYSF